MDHEDRKDGWIRVADSMERCGWGGKLHGEVGW
jgi:hypothetical protein